MRGNTQRARAELGARKDAGAKWDQQLALLFARSGWTQEQLAEKERKIQRWVSYRLTFGRFLNFSTTVLNPQIPLSSLTERRFRDYSGRARTQGNGITSDIAPSKQSDTVPVRRVIARPPLVNVVAGASSDFSSTPASPVVSPPLQRCQ
jgi:hypothetical protein